MRTRKDKTMTDNERAILRHLESAETAIEVARDLLMQGKFVRALHKLHEVVQEAKSARSFGLEEDAQRVLQVLGAKQ